MHTSQPLPSPSALKYLHARNPEILAALALMVRDPAKFDPLDYPGALTPAEDFNARWEMSGRRAAFYTRFRRSTAGAVLEVCAAMRNRAPHDGPRIAILEEMARELMAAEVPDAILNELYTGTGITSSPKERIAQDFAAPGLGFSGMTQRLKLPNALFESFS